ncbi:MAG TPA: hypothetical protein VM911_04800 [Pyrinomonadaceae bacterium]|nr:hypothetical protein [Pyrinomonadaceae bacterium]
MTKSRTIALALRTIVLMFVLLTAAQLVPAPAKASGYDPFIWGNEFRTWYYADAAHTNFVGYYVYNTCTGLEEGDGEHTVYYDQISKTVLCEGSYFGPNQ